MISAKKCIFVELILIGNEYEKSKSIYCNLSAYV